MVDLAKLTAQQLTRWNAASVDPDLIPLVDKVAHSLCAAKSRYQTVEAKTNVPWAVVAVIHQREASQSWSANLANGDPWSRPTIHVPAHRGPFPSWESAAEDALVICPPHAANWHDWSIGGALCLLEQYNGLGYFRMGMPSPYVWASTDQYSRGKYIADGHFDPNAVDHQIGCAALLARMTLIDRSIEGEWHP